MKGKLTNTKSVLWRPFFRIHRKLEALLNVMAPIPYCTVGVKTVQAQSALK
jgi:hypothetical protein